MFNKLINAFALTLAFGAVFYARPALATNPKENSHCLNGPDQGTKCVYLQQATLEDTGSNCYNSQDRDAGGNILRSWSLYFVGLNPKLYKCSESDKNDASTCPFGDVDCGWVGSYSEDGEHSREYLCVKAQENCQEHMKTGAEYAHNTGSTCR